MISTKSLLCFSILLILPACPFNEILWSELGQASNNGGGGCESDCGLEGDYFLPLAAPGKPEGVVSWGDNLYVTTGADFVFEGIPYVAGFDLVSGDSWTCPVPEAATELPLPSGTIKAGMSGVIANYEGDLLIAVPAFGVFKMNPLSCEYALWATWPEGTLLPNSPAATPYGDLFWTDSFGGTIIRCEEVEGGGNCEVFSEDPLLFDPSPGPDGCENIPGIPTPAFGANGSLYVPWSDSLLVVHTAPQTHILEVSLVDGSAEVIHTLPCGSWADELAFLADGTLVVTLAGDALTPEPGIGGLLYIRPDNTQETFGDIVLDQNQVPRLWGSPSGLAPVGNSHMAVAQHHSEWLGQEWGVIILETGEEGLPPIPALVD